MTSYDACCVPLILPEHFCDSNCGEDNMSPVHQGSFMVLVPHLIRPNMTRPNFDLRMNYESINVIRGDIKI